MNEEQDITHINKQEEATRRRWRNDLFFFFGLLVFDRVCVGEERKEETRGSRI